MAATNVQAFSGDVEISSNLAVSGSKFTYDNTNTTVFTGTASANANEIGYLDMSTSLASNNIHVKVYIKYGDGADLGDAEYSFYIRPSSANYSLIYDYRNRNGPITPVVYRTNATDLHSDGTPGVVRFGYSISASQNVIWRVEVQQRGGTATFYPTNTGSAVVTTDLVQVTPAPYTRIDSNVAVGGSDLFVDTVNSRVGIGTTDPGTALDVVGDIRASANITAYSDRRLKSDIEKIENALDKVCTLGGYTYTMKGQKYTGLIAQEVLEVLPEAVTGSEETNYALAYGNMMGLIVEAIKELKEKVG